MASTIIMPKQGLLMETGTIMKWLAKEGEVVKEGQPLFEMETDKLTITMDSTASGTVLKIVHPEGDTVPVTETIAIVGEPGEDISALLGAAPAAEAAAAPAAEEKKEEVKAEAAPVAQTRAPGEKVFSTPRARMRAEEKKVSVEDIPGSGPEGLVIEKDVLAYDGKSVRITPLAANVAANLGVDPATVTGTGVNGKIVAADVKAAAAPAAASVAAAPARGTRTVKMTGMEKAVARNMLNSKTTNAQTSMKFSIDMSALIKMRETFKAREIKVSFNDILIKACGKALIANPIVNASMGEDEIIYHDYANVGLAVSVKGGLIVPVVKDADLKNITDISADTVDLIAKAREGRLAIDEYKGGTFTISNLGMFGVENFVAIINPPESGILAVGTTVKTPVVETVNGVDTIVIKPMCDFTLSYDHRIVNGAEAAKFMKLLKDYLENPCLML